MNSCRSGDERDLLFARRPDFVVELREQAIVRPEQVDHDFQTALFQRESGPLPCRERHLIVMVVTRCQFALCRSTGREHGDRDCLLTPGRGLGGTSGHHRQSADKRQPER
jgi:hypothetical protein